MPLVSFQAQPQIAQIKFMTFEDSKKIGTREHEHAGDVIAFVVAARGRNDFVEPCHGERRRWDAGPR